MASGYSQPGSTYRHLNPVDIYDEQLVATVLGAKQQKYDANVAKIDAAIEQYGGIDLLRGKDKEYLNKRLNDLSSDINNAGIQDISSSAVTRNIMQHIDQAQDEYVMDQAVTTASIRAFGEKVNEVKKKNPELYTEQNEAYALHQSGFQDYMSGGADQLKSKLEYTSYVDVAGLQAEQLDKLASNKHGITRKVSTGDGYFVESTNYGLTRSDVRNNVLANLNPQQQKQLEIDAWATYGESAPKVYEEFVAPKVEALTGEKETLMLNYEGKTKAQKAIIDEKVAEINNEVSTLTSEKKSPAELYSFLGRESLIGKMTIKYAPTETSFKQSEDGSFYKNLEAVSKQADVASGNYDGNGNGLWDVSSKSIETDTEDNYIPTEKAEAELQLHQNKAKDITNGAYNRLPKDQQEAFDKSYSKYLKEQGLSDTPINKSSYMLDNSDQGKGGFFNASEVIAANREKRDFERKNEIKNKNFNAALDEQRAVNEQKVIEGLKANSGIMITNERGQVVSAADYIGSGELTKEKKDIIFKSVYADFALSKTKDYEAGENTHATNTYNISRLASMFGETGAEQPMLVNPDNITYSGYSKGKDFESIKKDMQLPPQMSEKQFKEHILPIVQGRAETTDGGMFDFFKNTRDKIATNFRHSFVGGSVQGNLIIGGENTKTRAALETALKNKTYDRASFFDDSVEDDQTMNQALSDRSSFRDSYEAKMARDGSNFNQNKIITVEPSGSRKGTSVLAFEELVAKSEGNFDKGKHINLIDLNEDYYLAYQTDEEVTAKDDEESIKKKSKSAKILKNDLRGGEFMKWVNKKGEGERITTANTPKVASGSIGFADEKDQRSYVVNLAKEFGITSEKELAKFTSQGARAELFSTHAELFNDGAAGKEFKAFADTMINNSHLFRVEVQANDMDMYDLAIQYKDGDKWKNLKVMPTQTDDITDMVAMVDVAPQVFYSDYMNRLFTKIEKDGADSVKDDIQLLRKIIYPQ